MRPDAAKCHISATASEVLETPPRTRIGNKAGIDSRASDAGVRYRGVEKGISKSQQTRLRLCRMLSKWLPVSFPTRSQSTSSISARRKQNKTGEDMEALSRHCIKCGLSGCWEGRSSVPLLMQARMRRCCGSRRKQRWSFCNMGSMYLYHGR